LQVEFLEGRLRSSEASGASVKEDLEEEIKALKSALEGAPPSSLRFEGAQEMERRLEEAQEGQESMKKELERVQEDLAGAREGLETVRAAAMMKLDQLCEEVSRSDEALQASREEARKMGEDVMRLEEEVRGARAMASTGVEDETERLREEVMRLEESVRGARAEASRGEEEARSARDLLFKAQEGRDEKVAEMLQLRSKPRSYIL
jgi:chromosome segregation ATPase